MTRNDTDLSAARLGVAAAAISGNSGGLYRLTAELMDDGVSFETLLFDLLLGIEREVGLRWQEGDYLIAEEHAATATIETVIALLAGSFDQPEEGRSVVVASAEGDAHSLSGRAIAAHLLFLGYRTNFLGANVVARDLGEFLDSDRPEALVVSCAMANHLLGARRVISESHRVGVPVLVGGRGFGPDSARASALGADGWAGEARAVASILENWHPDIEASERQARDPSPGLIDLVARRGEVISAAGSSLRQQMPLDPDSRLIDELGILLGAIEASMLLEDESILQEVLAWQKAILRAHGYATSDHLPRALVEGLQGQHPDAAQLLRAAMESG